MKIIYKARDIIEAHIVAGMLNANGIETHVGGYYLQGGVGDVTVFDFANVQVADEDVAAAIPLVAEYENAENQETEYDMKNLGDDGCLVS
jgi:hypothetical protein